MNAPIYTFKMNLTDGSIQSLEDYKDRVLLIVNTASRCGFTPQYKGLEKLYQTYKDRGFTLLGFPCDQFAHQEPLNDAEIADFCAKNYGVSFPVSKKIRVNGQNADPLFQYLTDALPGLMGCRMIKWNFTKFLIDRQGKPYKRYGSMIKPESIAIDIERLIA